MNTVSKDQGNQVNLSSAEVSFLPRSLLSTSRSEFYKGKDRKPEEQSLQLTVKAGLSDELTELPDDLIGSMFMIAPVGLVDSPKVEGTDTILPTQDGWTHLLNGDGMVYRVDFGQREPEFSSRLMSNVSYYADKITHSKYPLLKFITYGLARSSLILGGANQLNTAFLKLPAVDKRPERLLVTSDVERPMEIDPVSLRIISPVGLNKDWEASLKLTLQNKPIKNFITAAHPVAVPGSQTLISVNSVKSLWIVLGVNRLFKHNLKLLVLSLGKSKINHALLRAAFILLEFLAQGVFKLLQNLNIAARENLTLVRWDGENDKFDTWNVNLEDGSPIKISQTVHQIGLTRNYIVFADTAFKISLSSLLPAKSSFDNFSESEQKFYEWAQSNRKYIDFPLLEDTRLFILSRSQLNEIEPGGALVAKEVLLKDAAIAHYTVDFDDTDGNITLHAALNQDTDFAEFIHSDDQFTSATIKASHRMPHMLGMFSGGLEINRPVTYVIDAKVGHVCHAATIPIEEASRYTWSIGTYACQTNSSTEQYDDIYWSNFGAWPEILPDSVVDLYRSKTEQESQQFKEFLERLNEGGENSICRIHIDRTQRFKIALSVADFYNFPQKSGITYFGNSPQFIPRYGATESTNGYITCAVNYSDESCSSCPGELIGKHSWSANSEIWIFDAQNLSQGPLYRLSHAKLNFGMTLHTTWLEKITSSRNQREYDVRKDFEHLVASAVEYHSRRKPYEARQISQLFQEIYSEIEREQREADA